MHVAAYQTYADTTLVPDFVFYDTLAACQTHFTTYPAAAALVQPDIRLIPALFDSQTKVEYTLPENGFVTIRVYNMQGILVETLVSKEYRDAGSYQLNDEGGDYTNGLYLFSLEVCDRNKAVVGVKY